MTSADRIQDIAAKAAIVGRDRAAYDAEKVADKEARAEVLGALVDAVRPALRALCNRVAVEMTKTSAGTTTEPAPFRGLLLASDNGPGGGPTRLASRADIKRGRWAGADLVLTDRGELVELRYDGRWADVPGEVSGWRAEVVPTTALRVASTGHDLEAIVLAVEAALRGQGGGEMVPRTVDLAGRSARLRAIAKTLRSSL